MQTLKLTKKYEQYPEYNDSGVEWLGKIPREWQARKIKTFSKTLAGGTPSTDNLLYWENGTIPWLPSGMIHDNVIFKNTKEKYITELGLKESATKIIPEDSVLLALTGATCGNISYLTFKATANQSVVAVVNNKQNSSAKYIYYALLANREQILVKRTGGAQSGINEQDVKNLFISFPNINNQTKIANYLDKKTTSIDQIIEKKQKLIELLREKRTAVINHAVTKGLNQKAELVESGVDWIGRIPKGWNVSSLKTLLAMKITDGPHTTPKLYDDGVRFISAESIQANNTINFNKNRGFISQQDHVEFCKKAKPQRDDIFMVKSGATTGRVAIVETDSEFSIWSPLALIRTDNSKALSKYIYLFLQSGLFQDQVKFSWSFGTQQNIGMRVIENLMILYPSVKNQKEIVKYLESKLPNFEIAIQKVEKSIEILQEFKSSLISNVITGKVKV